MPFITRDGKLYARCVVCGYQSRYPRKDKADVPQGWDGDDGYLLCSFCADERDEQQSEQYAVLWL